MKADWQDLHRWRDGKYQQTWIWRISREHQYKIFETAGLYWPTSSSGMTISSLGCPSLNEAKLTCIGHYNSYFVKGLGYPDIEI
jgi:hypothetical protein